ncbi:heparinase II/III family protein [Pseudaminobacter soli (ex Li et al. 2025)]|uniref:Heparinase n=1 Tax=Pseudaminobacter soli (ex Li et al. 2025) TaxID=1295366 RepID=A0A2P7SCT8_9HYPH|nr:alginate lyase family protein [Mesorhizobium soli]PSJ60288.1 heparinase [Mesorhizobium soli]
MLKRLNWYARRLAVMERGEIRHRVREQLARRAARRERRDWADFVIPGARPTPIHLFAPLFEPALPEPVERQLQTAAETLRSGHLRLLNRDWPGSVLDSSGRVDSAIWTLDPVSGASWPGAERSAFDIDFRFEAGHGDVKYVAELNRLHFLASPAIHARRALDPELARAILSSIISWMEANPPGRGVNWYSGIEAGYRLVSLLCIVAALEPWIDAATGERLASFVAAHGSWLARFPSLHSSANNHLVAEAMGLVLAAQLLPEHPDAAMWLTTGRAHLENRTLALFHEDGVGQEQSPAYSAFTLEMLLIGFAAMGAGAPGPKTRERMAQAASALNAFLDDDGHAPLIGDDDQSRVLMAFGSDEPRYIASIAGAIAGFLGRPDLTPSIRDPHWRDIVFATPPCSPQLTDGTITFPQGGYTVRRGEIDGRRVHLVFDHGPLGFGALAAHGHADALSVWLSLDGRPVLVDAGTHLYHSEGENRRRFRVSALHNTLTIDGASQSEPSGAFNWMPRRAKATLDSVAHAARLDISASHDGYAKRFGAVHHRRIVETTNGFDIADRLTGTPPSGEVEIAFLLAPDLEASVEDHGVVARRGSRTEFTLVAPAGAAIQIVRADAASGRGFHSPGFGILREAATVVFRAPARQMHWQSSILIDPLT